MAAYFGPFVTSAIREWRVECAGHPTIADPSGLDTYFLKLAPLTTCDPPLGARYLIDFGDFRVLTSTNGDGPHFRF